MDLNQLRLFSAIATHGSLTKVSIALNVEQSVISRQLIALETELGERLFTRTGRGMTLTDLGTSVLPRVRQLLEQVDLLAEEIKSEVGVLSGDVRLGLLPTFSYPLANKLYKNMRERFPRVQLHLYEGSNGQLTEWIGTGRVDIAILYRYDSVEESKVTVLGSSQACLISRVDDPLTSESEITFNQLKDLPLVLPSAPNALPETLLDIARSQNFTLNVVLQADSVPIQKNMVLAGEAYTILGSQAIIREREAGLLRAARIIDPEIPRTVVLAISSQRPYTLAMRTVAKAIEPLIVETLDRTR